MLKTITATILVTVCCALLPIGIGLLAKRRPVLFYKLLLRVRLALSGCKVRHVHLRGNQRVAYAERTCSSQSRGVILLVHGYSSSKETYSNMIRHMPRTHRLISVDLPGHGGSSDVDNEELTLEGFAAFLDEFCTALDLYSDRLHVIGASLGGAICGVFAAKHAHHRLASITMMCPVGIRVDRKSPIETEYETTGRVLLIPGTIGEVKELIKLSSVKQPPFTLHVVLRGFLQFINEHQETFEMVLRHLKHENYRYLLENEIENIQAPTLVTWGKEDKLLDVSSVEVIKRKLPSCEVRVFEQCGHKILIDKTKEMATITMNFIDKHS